MNLLNLFKVMPTSIRLRNDQSDDSGGGLLIKYCPPKRLEPEEKSLSETTPDSPPLEGNTEQGDEIETRSIRLFENDANFIDDILKLAKVWNQLDAPDGMALIEKRREIARWLSGKRNVDDCVLFMELLADNVNIDNAWLSQYLGDV